MTASYVRLARLREVLNSVQALRGVPAEMGAGGRQRRPELGGDLLPHSLSVAQVFVLVRA